MNAPSYRDPLELVVTLKYASVEEFEAGFAPCVSAEHIFFKTKTVRPMGTPVRLELRLRDGFPALIVQGQVRWSLGPDLVPLGRAPGMGMQVSPVDDISARRLESILAKHGQGELARPPGSNAWASFKQRQPRAAGVVLGAKDEAAPPPVDALHRDLDDAFASILGTSDDVATTPTLSMMPPMPDNAAGGLVDALRAAGAGARSSPPLAPPRDPTNPFGVAVITDGEGNKDGSMQFQALSAGTLDSPPSGAAQQWRKNMVAPEMPKPPPRGPSWTPISSNPSALPAPAAARPQAPVAVVAAVAAKPALPPPVPLPPPTVVQEPPPPPEEPQLLSDAEADLLDEVALFDPAPAAPVVEPRPVLMAPPEATAPPPPEPPPVEEPPPPVEEPPPPVEEPPPPVEEPPPPVEEPPAPVDEPAAPVREPPPSVDEPPPAAAQAPVFAALVAEYFYSAPVDEAPAVVEAQPPAPPVETAPVAAALEEPAPPVESAPVAAAVEASAPPVERAPVAAALEASAPQVEEAPSPATSIHEPAPDLFATSVADAAPPAIHEPTPDVFAPAASDLAPPEPPPPPPPPVEEPARAVVALPQVRPAQRLPPGDFLDETVTTTRVAVVTPLPVPQALLDAERGWAAVVARAAETRVQVGFQFTLGFDARAGAQAPLALEPVHWPTGDRTRREVAVVVFDETSGRATPAPAEAEPASNVTMNLGPPPLRRAIAEELSTTTETDPWAPSFKSTALPTLADSNPPTPAPPPASDVDDVFSSAPAPTAVVVEPPAPTPPEPAEAPQPPAALVDDGWTSGFADAVVPPPAVPGAPADDGPSLQMRPSLMTAAATETAPATTPDASDGWAVGFADAPALPSLSAPVTSEEPVTAISTVPDIHDAVTAPPSTLAQPEADAFQQEGAGTPPPVAEPDGNPEGFDHSSGEITHVTSRPVDEEEAFSDELPPVPAISAADARAAPQGPAAMVQGVGIGLPGGRLRQVFGAGTALPAHWTKQIPGARTGALELDVHESPSERASDGHLLGKVAAKPPKQEQGAEWILDFSVDGDAVLKVMAHPAGVPDFRIERLYALENTTVRGRARVARAQPKDPEGGGGGFMRRLMGR